MQSKSLQKARYVNAIRPTAIVNNASCTSQVIDATGFAKATVVVSLGATDIALTALKVQHCDTSGGTYADVTGLVAGTSTDIYGTASALPSATDDNGVYVFEVNVQKPFLKVVATVGNGSTGAYVSAVALLHSASQAPSSLTGSNALGILAV
jgi:hypothetical protein